MNLADYLSELLGQHDEVSVPGLGHFVRVRVNAYYNDKQAIFYPPYHQVKFVPQLNDDDTFVQYVADKKNISLASSKYFAEKFISKLKEESAKGKYLFADLGIFYTYQDQLVFKANEKVTTDPSFYGYPQLNVYKLGQPMSPGDAKPVFAQTASSPVVSAPTAQTIEPEQYFEEETERKRSVSVWLIVLIGLTMIALSVFGVYEFYPAAFDKLNTSYYKIIGKKDTSVPVDQREIKTDRAKKTISGKDTAANTNVPLTPVIDTLKLLHFEVIANKFKKWQKARAEAEVVRYKSIGLDAKISTDAPGPLLKISVGTYFTLKEADSARLTLINSGKITWRSEKPLQINPQK